MLSWGLLAAVLCHWNETSGRVRWSLCPSDRTAALSLLRPFPSIAPNSTLSIACIEATGPASISLFAVNFLKDHAAGSIVLVNLTLELV